MRETTKYKPPGGLYLQGRFNGGFLALRVWGAYIWRGLYTAGLIFGILRYLQNWLIANRLTLNMLIKDLIRFMHSLSRKRQNRESKRKALIVPHSSPVGVDTYGPLAVAVSSQDFTSGANLVIGLCSGIHFVDCRIQNQDSFPAFSPLSCMFSFI